MASLDATRSSHLGTVHRALMGAALRVDGSGAEAAGRVCKIAGYLQRKLHRQWRTRGS